MSYVFPDHNNNIQFEVFQTQKTCRGYLSVHSHPIVPSSLDPKKALVALYIEQDSFTFLASRHEGGNRLLLPEKELTKILSALSENKEIWIETSGYKSKISPEGFSSTYKKFQNPSKLPKLIHLPL